jgi:hypothetical protein
VAGIDPRSALDVLKKPRLLEIGRSFDVEVAARRPKADIVAALKEGPSVHDSDGCEKRLRPTRSQHAIAT